MTGVALPGMEPARREDWLPALKARFIGHGIEGGEAAMEEWLEDFEHCAASGWGMGPGQYERFAQSVRDEVGKLKVSA